jgi:hypothetical protein
MKAKSKAIRTATLCSFLILFGSNTFAQQSSTIEISEKTIASKRTGSLVITLTNDSGKLTAGVNDFCALFQSRSPATAIDAQEIAVDFRLRVGRILEVPVTAHLSRNSVGRYCGQINLGQQYYRPANYYVLVRYVEVTGKKKSTGLSLAVR